jgi:hypothetical protein
MRDEWVRGRQVEEEEEEVVLSCEGVRGDVYSSGSNRNSSTNSNSSTKATAALVATATAVGARERETDQMHPFVCYETSRKKGSSNEQNPFSETWNEA